MPNRPNRAGATPAQRLPYARSNVMADATNPRGSSHFARRALVVDDEPLIRWSVSEVLAESGFDVVEAGTARAAREAVDESNGPFHLIVLDLRLPDSDNLSLLIELHRRMPAARIVVMSAHGTEETAARVRELGAYSFLPKPFEMVSISQLIAASAAGAS